MKYHEIIAASDGQQFPPAAQADRRNLPKLLDPTSIDEPINRLYVDLKNALKKV